MGLKLIRWAYAAVTRQQGFRRVFITSHVIAGKWYVTDSGTAPDETMRID
jgi:hypothetical protein